MKWRGKHGVWICEPFTIRTDVDARTHVVLFELYDSTRFVSMFTSAQDAKKHAENMNGRAQEKAS